MSLALFKKVDVQAMTIASGHDLFGPRLAADDRVLSKMRSRSAGSRGQNPIVLAAGS